MELTYDMVSISPIIMASLGATIEGEKDLFRRVYFCDGDTSDQ